ncbi:hypothetical protein EL17_22330 [Anditalea andensis]|uniref:Uncharacterized protein n=1 Tax=Anditalea andensis TaxID=1048983 RepID=A0A074L0K7_9BACT|nr:hypothetical protein EL17_22330 [Anditalea andensis]
MSFWVNYIVFHLFITFSDTILFKGERKEGILNSSLCINSLREISSIHLQVVEHHSKILSFSIQHEHLNLVFDKNFINIKIIN